MYVCEGLRLWRLLKEWLYRRGGTWRILLGLEHLTSSLVMYASRVWTPLIMRGLFKPVYRRAARCAGIHTSRWSFVGFSNKYRRRVSPLTAKLFNSNFHPLEVVSRWRDPQLQVSENYSDSTKLRSTLFKSCWLMSHFILNIFKMWYLMC